MKKYNVHYLLEDGTRHVKKVEADSYDEANEKFIKFTKSSEFGNSKLKMYGCIQVFR